MGYLLTFIYFWGGIELINAILKHSGFLPILEVIDTYGKNGSNNGLKIKMNKQTILKNPNAEGVFAQEYREFYLYPLLFLEMFESFSKRLQRRKEYKGHALEIAWGDTFVEGFDKEEYRTLEALAMKKRYSQFKGLPLQDIIEGLNKYEHESYAYIKKHESKIKRMYGKMEGTV